MNQEDKQLLLKDLCTRLPYGVKCGIFNADETLKNVEETIFYVAGPNIVTFEGNERDECYMYWQVKPYLRPMSSMTEEEKKERKYFITKFEYDDYWHPGEYADYVGVGELDDYIDWLNQYHFDYRGLIEKGLALEAPADMYL